MLTLSSAYGCAAARCCPSRGILEHVTGRSSVLVLIAPLDGTHRFSELRRKVGEVSEKMLSQTLEALEGDGLIDRVSHPVVPPHVEYSPTPLGVEAARCVEALTDWIQGNVEAILGARDRP